MALLANWFRRRRCTRRGRTRLRLEPLEPRVLLSGSPLISEFMAINDNFRADEDGDCSDWIELYNPGPSAVSLLDWCLTDEQGDPDPWRFPDVELAAGQHLTVFASDKDRSAAGSELHADFKLAGGGEYLALLMPDGVTAVSEFDPYPAQQADVSYGIAMEAASPLLVAAGAAAEALVPTDGALGLSWTETAFVPSGWTAGATGVGYENRSGFESLIALDVKAGMFNTNGSVYIRVPFTVSEGATISTLTLRMKYDDGFAAYLDGEPVASRNAPGEPQWNALATGHHPDAQAVVYETIDLTDHAALLAPGPHVLALQGLNVSLGSTDFVPLENELRIAERYCELQALRFGDRLKYEVVRDPDVTDVDVPSLIIQPLIENAIIHGIEPLDSQGSVTVRAEYRNDRLVISVEDNGVGFRPGPIERSTHIGLANVRERLSLAYTHAELSIESEPGRGTCCSISIAASEVRACAL